MNICKKILIIIFFFSFTIILYADTTNVLFIGNSYTYVNDLPNLFKQLSASGGKIVYTDMSAPGGYSFNQHITNQTTTDFIKLGKWNYVVLQEQSQMPVIDYYKYNFTFPSAIILDSMIKASNPTATTVFYMTWGRKNGGQQCIDTSCSPVFVNYFHMQDSLKLAYSYMTNRVSAMLSPCGEAWRKALQLNPNVNLWDTDESHPLLIGSYLNACVFYAKIFNQSPVGLTFTGGLSNAEALFCQQCAYQSVMKVNNINNSVPANYKLEQNYPNPFNQSSIIKFQCSIKSEITLKIYDMLGREVQTLVNEKKSPGIYEVIFDGGNLASGIYFYSFIINEKIIDTKKLIILK